MSDTVGQRRTLSDIGFTKGVVEGYTGNRAQNFANCFFVYIVLRIFLYLSQFQPRDDGLFRVYGLPSHYERVKDNRSLCISTKYQSPLDVV